MLILRNEDVRRRKYTWVLTCRRVCRGRSAIHEEEKEKKKKLVEISSSLGFGIIPR